MARTSSADVDELVVGAFVRSERGSEAAGVGSSPGAGGLLVLGPRGTPDPGIHTTNDPQNCVFATISSYFSEYSYILISPHEQ